MRLARMCLLTLTVPLALAGFACEDGKKESAEARDSRRPASEAIGETIALPSELEHELSTPIEDWTGFEDGRMDSAEFDLRYRIEASPVTGKVERVALRGKGLQDAALEAWGDPFEVEEAPVESGNPTYHWVDESTALRAEVNTAPAGDSLYISHYTPYDAFLLEDGRFFFEPEGGLLGQPFELEEAPNMTTGSTDTGFNFAPSTIAGNSLLGGWGSVELGAEGTVDLIDVYVPTHDNAPDLTAVLESRFGAPEMSRNIAVYSLGDSGRRLEVKRESSAWRLKLSADEGEPSE